VSLVREHPAVQHSSILGFLAPIEAAGRALIIATGVLVVLFGEAEGELEPR
jgi:hypothetical protein